MAKKYIESNIIEYKDVTKILGFTCRIKGETSECYYQKEFRYSNDNILWSDYRGLSEKNLGTVKPEGSTLYVQYRFTQVGLGLLSVEDISLNVVYGNGENSIIPDCYWTTVNTNRYSPSIVYNGSNQNLFNPYAIGSGYSFYNQMSTLISNMFGLCVLYFKTEPNARTRDVVLKEYSIEHVVDKQNVKILVPDNQLPTRELQFNSMMIDYPVQFEVHIVKSEFQNMFGQDAHPDPHDYLYFQAYMNKMYMVDAVSEPDDFGYNGTYWRVSLVPYQELSSVKFDDEDLQTDTETLIFSAEGKFGDEVQDEFDDIRKDNQLNDMGDWQEGQDHMRRYLDPHVRIKKEDIYNDWTVIADSYYDMSTIERDKLVNEYRYTTGFGSKDERMFSFLFRPINTDKNISQNINISKMEKGEFGGVRLYVNKWSSLFEVGNVVKISKTTDLNGFHKIIDSNAKLKYIEIEGEMQEERTKTTNCGRLVAYEVNNMFQIRKDDGTVMEISQYPDHIKMKFNGVDYRYYFEDFTKFESKWYIMLLGAKSGMSNLWMYELTGSEKEGNRHSKLNLVGKTSNDWGEFDLGETCYYDLMSCNLKMSNFRMWSKLCEEDLHNVILSEIVVDDTHNTLIVDNAKSELLLNNKWS